MKNLNDLKNKEFAFECIKMLLSAEKFNITLFNQLCDRDFCKDKFSCSFSIITEVPMYGDILEDYYLDNAGHRRYYPERVYLENKAYLITNHWYGSNETQADNRTPFMNWILFKIR